MLLRLAALLLLLPTLGLAAPWRIDPGTEVEVDVAWRGGTVAVSFPDLSGSIDFDADHPERAQAVIVVATTTATTGLAIVDELVRSDGYLQADRYPQMTFRLDRLVQRSRTSADVEGRITLRGVTLPVTFAANVIRYGPAAADPGRFGPHALGRLLEQEELVLERRADAKAHARGPSDRALQQPARAHGRVGAVWPTFAPPPMRRAARWACSSIWPGRRFASANSSPIRRTANRRKSSPSFAALNRTAKTS
jgi:polyisoprenoid-binding protein YceI